LNTLFAKSFISNINFEIWLFLFLLLLNFLILNEKHVATFTDGAELLEGLDWRLLDIFIVGLYVGVFEESFSVALVVACALLAAHHSTLVTRKHNFLVVMDLTVFFKI